MGRIDATRKPIYKSEDKTRAEAPVPMEAKTLGTQPYVEGTLTSAQASGSGGVVLAYVPSFRSVQVHSFDATNLKDLKSKQARERAGRHNINYTMAAVPGACVCACIFPFHTL